MQQEIYKIGTEMFFWSCSFLAYFNKLTHTVKQDHRGNRWMCNIMYAVMSSCSGISRAYTAQCIYLLESSKRVSIDVDLKCTKAPRNSIRWNSGYTIVFRSQKEYIFVSTGWGNTKGRKSKNIERPYPQLVSRGEFDQDCFTFWYLIILAAKKFLVVGTRSHV